MPIMENIKNFIKKITGGGRLPNIINSDSAMPIEKIIAIQVKEFKQSNEYQTMLAAKRYYDNQNDILNKKRYYIQNGIKHEDNNVANNKISHPFLRQLADQKVQYLLANDWSIDDDNAADAFNDEFRQKLQTAARDSVIYGIGWLFPTLQDNEFIFRRYPSYEIIPLWTDNEHTNFDGIIRMFSQIEYVAENKIIVEYVEYWTTDGVSTYRKNNDSYTLIRTAPHLETNGKGYNWTKIPFIPIKYNVDEISLLQMIKSLIDEYDRTVSDTADLMADLTNKIMALTGANGTDIAEFSQNLQLYRKVALPEGGTLTEIGTDPDISASIAHQNQLRGNIYEFGRGVDYNANIGLSASGEARKYLYANLDLDCNQLEAGVLTALRQIIWFLNNSPAGGYNIDPNVKITFSRNMMINSTEIIDNAVKAQGITGVSMQTIVGLLPFVEDAQAEIDKWQAEQDSEIEKQQEIISKVDNMQV